MKNARPTEVKPSALSALTSMAIIVANNPTVQQLAHLELIAAALSLSGFCPQGRLIDTCEQSGYSRDETRTLITALVDLGLVELSVTKESPFQVNVAVCDGAELLEVVQ
ncbi:MAG TPA: hypothetical protein VFD09_01240 [Thiopseudomonas sp.]|nr:hypothetical protein [Thiopseudomonas sp.]